MNDIQRSKLESAVEAMAVAVVEEAEPQLRAYGVTAQRPVVTHHPHKHQVHSSELEIVFNKEDDFFDIIEFFIWRDGAPALGVDDARQAIRSQLDAVIENARTGNTPWSRA